MAPSNSELLVFISISRFTNKFTNNFSLCQHLQEKLYKKVTEQVLSPDGLSIDEKILQELKKTWRSKLAAHRALQPPPGITHSAPGTKPQSESPNSVF